MAGANEVELREVLILIIVHPAIFLVFSPSFFQAFKLFDADGDGLISAEELKSLISKVDNQDKMNVFGFYVSTFYIFQR